MNEGRRDRTPLRPAEFIVKFREGPDRWLDEENGRLVASGFDVDPFHRIVKTLGNAARGGFARACFPRLGRRLRPRGVEAVLIGRKRPVRLDLYARVSLLGVEHGLRSALATLRGDPEIAYVVPALEPVPAQLSAPIPTPDLSHCQGYLEAAPHGVDAQFAWGIPGGDGSGVKVLVVDEGFNQNHEDMPAVSLLNGAPFAGQIMEEEHGTKVLGLLAGKHNGTGVSGICHGAGIAFGTWYVDLSEIPAEETEEANRLSAVTTLLDQAIEVLDPGDILVLEFQLKDLTGKLLPADYDVDVRKGVQALAGQGILVVLAAGNGGLNLNHELAPRADTGALAEIWNPDPQNLDYDDSLAVMVGAGRCPSAGTDERKRASTSNYGGRVTCQGWGECVATFGRSSNDLWVSVDPYAPTDQDRFYTELFSGTSSATAMVAGVAASLQGAYRAKVQGIAEFAASLDPEQIRDLLRDPKNGSAQPGFDPATGGVQSGSDAHLYPIGPLPHLGLLLSSSGIAADPFLRDHPEDSGEGPWDERRYECPDLILRNEPVVPLPGLRPGSGCWSDAFPGQQVRSGQDNYIYVLLRNRAKVPDDIRVDVHWTPLATFLHPTFWKRIGSSDPLRIGSDESRVIPVPICWPKEQLPATGEIALIGVVHAARSPLSIPGAGASSAEFLSFLRTSDRIGFRNVRTVEVIPGEFSAPCSFWLRGILEETRRFWIQARLGVPEGSTLRFSASFPSPWERELIVTSELPPSPSLWPPSADEGPFHGRPGEPLEVRGIEVSPEQPIQIALQVLLPPETPAGCYELTLDQWMETQQEGQSEQVGRLNFIFEVPAPA